MSGNDTLLDADEAMLVRLAACDLALAEKVHAAAMAAGDADEIASLGRTYQRLARSLRQTLALKARLKRDREREARANPPPPPPRDEARIRRRMDDLRRPVRRVIWAEHEHAEDEDEVGYWFDLLEERMDLRARDDAFGLEPLDEHVVSMCLDLGLPEAVARAWRDLPDPLWTDQEDDEADDLIEGQSRVIESSG